MGKTFDIKANQRISPNTSNSTSNQQMLQLLNGLNRYNDRDRNILLNFIYNSARNYL